MSNLCPLCRSDFSTGAELWEFSPTERYFHCLSCDLISMTAADRPGPEEERARYLEHNNSADDPRYVDYLEAFAAEALLPAVAPPGRVLDYGSGPEPVFVSVIETLGYSVDHYDPHFAPDDRWKSRSYDAVTLVEVAEHFFTPRREFERIRAVLKPGGVIALRTLLHYSDRDRFESWWYRRDRTHVCFYSRRSFEYLARELQFSLEDVVEGRSVVLRKEPSPPD